MNVEGVFESRRRAHIGQCGAARGGVAVFNPAIELLGREAAQVRCEIRVSSDCKAELYKLVRAEPIWIVTVCIRSASRLAAIPEIRAARALFNRAGSVAPVIAVCEAAPWKANNRGMDLLHFVDQVLANAANVGHLRVLTDPYAVVNHSAQILCEMAVDVG